MIYVIIYFVIGCLVGIAAYRQLKGSRRRLLGSILSCLLWPLMFGLFIVVVFENVNPREGNEHEEQE